MNIRMHLDVSDARKIAGWAIDEADFTHRVALEVWADGRFQTVIFARNFRQDLYDAGIGDGWHAFEYHWRAPVAGRVPRLELRAFPSGEVVKG